MTQRRARRQMFFFLFGTHQMNSVKQVKLPNDAGVDTEQEKKEAIDGQCVYVTIVRVRGHTKYCTGRVLMRPSSLERIPFAFRFSHNI